MIYLVSGAGGSGKSEYAEMLVCELAKRDGIQQKIYLATMENVSLEAKERIARHQRMRSGKGFVTVESPFGISAEQANNNSLHGKIILLECISNLLANLMFEKHMTREEACGEILSQIVQAECEHIVIVTNEIFSDGAMFDGEMKEYHRALGRINGQLAQRADVFCEVVYSIPVFLKGEVLCPC